MAAVNSVQNGVHLPLVGLAPPRLLMCSASMGAEGSVTLQLREAVQTSESGSSLDNALTIGYPDPDILADVLGNLQTAALNNSNSNTVVSTSSNSNTNRYNSLMNDKVQSTSPMNSIISSSVSNSPSSKTQAIPNTSNSNNSLISVNCNENLVPAANSQIISKKQRPKTSSPTRHGPQQCQVCSKIFGNASALAKHKLTHSDERKYVCVMCSKAFKRQDHLNGHMLTHRNKKPYECKAEGCGKSYCDARSLRRHTENHHSTLATTPTTPNQSTSSSTGPPTGLSLSPSTASGDASSPHGATCTRYITNSDIATSKPSSPGSPGINGNEGLTRQQLDLISQIMHHTKQASAQVTVSSDTNGLKNHQHQRPRTWNMQTQLQQNQIKLTTDAITESGNVNMDIVTTTTSHQDIQLQQPSTTSTNYQITNALNIIKIEQKPVECNLCHRKFKNIPALNGHMRLHGGYFKKDTDTKKCEKKENTGPPLQTASIGVRALIEEKIINKRSRDLKGAFVVPAPPSTILRRLNEGTEFLINKTTPVVVTSGSSSTVLNNASQVTTTIATSTQLQNDALHKLVTSSSNIETKDATLIELLKRGSKISVKRTCSDPGQIYTTNTGNSTMVLHPNSTTMSITSNSLNTPNPTPPLALSLSNDTSPLALTISQSENNTDDLFTLTYSTDSSTTFFSENDVYSVSDSAMLLQAVDSIHLLNDTTTNEQLDEISSLNDFSIDGNTSRQITNSSSSSNQEYRRPSKQLQAVLDSPLPDSIAEFSTIHSKDYILYNCTSNGSSTTQSSSVSPLPSPLAYPTPPASHEAVTQASPFLDETHHFTDGHSLFDEKTNSFIEENNEQYFKEDVDCDLSENEKILKLKNELFNESKSVLQENERFFKSAEEAAKVFASEVKVDDLLNESNNEQCDIKDFNHQNLSFLDEPTNFLDDNRNTSSPLSASLFSSTITTAEEVKQVLKDILPNENINGDMQSENNIDLYYLPGLALQSQMMPNSDDPLLSSSPKDFVQRVQPQQQGSCMVLENIPNNTIVSNKSLRQNEEVVPMATNQSSYKYNEFLNNPVTNTINLNKVCQPSSSILKKRLRQGIPKKSELYRSKLRKPSITHFTPSPILNPERKSSGLFSIIPKSALEDPVILVDEYEDNRNILTFLDDSKVNIGTAFQATIPIFTPNELMTKSVNEELMWDPKKSNDDKLLTRYIELSKSSAVPMGFHSEEIALKALLDADGETHVAILQLLQAPSTSVYLKWQPYEIETFLKGLEVYGKDFYQIGKQITTKTTGDCIQMYYFWKKLCTDYKITHLKQDPTVIEETLMPQHSQSELRPHVCEMPDCSASFTSKAALHGHRRIHCIGRNINLLGNNQIQMNSNQGQIIKDDFPCKVCGKVFNKVKSRSAHMKSHRPQDNEIVPSA